jgi:hypothetical protein
MVSRGDIERAIELYALASRHPLVASARWFWDIAGQHIAVAAAALSPGVVSAAWERGRARDLDDLAQEVLIELSE